MNRVVLVIIAFIAGVAVAFLGKVLGLSAVISRAATFAVVIIIILAGWRRRPAERVVETRR